VSAGGRERLVHHELCFGCGRANLFGLLIELERPSEGLVTGRCFIKQDHQGPQPGIAHEGIVAAALSEAMSFACGPNVRARSVEVSIDGPLPVGAYLEIVARALDATDGGLQATATGTVDDGRIAIGRGSYEPI
jgi:acyl-coenzyme A thioesterase PaaI-like protein